MGAIPFRARAEEENGPRNSRNRSSATNLRLWLSVLLVSAGLLVLAGLSASMTAAGPKGAGPKASAARPSSLTERPSIVATLSDPPAIIVAEDDPQAEYEFRASIKAARVGFNNRGRPRPGADFTSDNTRLSFALRVTSDSEVSQTAPNQIEFSVDQTTKVRYSVDKTQVKEEIVLSAPPLGNRFTFDYSESGLTRVRSANGGYRFTDGQNAEKYRMLPSTAIDSRGVTGDTQLQIAGAELAIIVDRNFLLEATYPVTIDPTVVGTSGAQTATAWASQRKVVSLTDDSLITVFTGPPAQNSGCGTGGSSVDCGDTVYWARSTDDGATWTSTATGAYGRAAAVVADSSNDLYLAYETTTGAGANNGEVSFRKGTYSAGPSYSWTPRKLIGTTQLDHVPSVAIDSAGVIHVVFDYHSVSAAKRSRVMWTYSSNGGSTFCSPVNITLSEYSSNFTSGTFPSIAVDDNDDLYVTWNNGNGTFYVRRRAAGSLACNTGSWGGSAWGTFTATGSPFAAATNAMMFHSSLIGAAGGRLALVIPNNNSISGYQYKLVTSATGASASWQTVTGIDGSAVGDGYPGLARHGDDYYVVLKDSPSGYSNLALYRSSVSGLTKESFLTDAASTNNHPTVMANSDDDRLHVAWTNGNGSPFTVKYDFVALPREPSNLTQLAADHSSVIAAGDSATDGSATNLYFDMSMDSSASVDALTPKLEILPVGIPFTGLATNTGDAVDYSGEPVTGSIAVTGLTLDTSYHWQAWVSNMTGDSVKTSFGGNPESSPDVSVASVMGLSLDNTFNRDGTSGGGAVDFGSVPPDASPFLIHGDSDKNAVQLSVVSNNSWDLTVAAGGNFVDGPKSIPIDVLQWRSHSSSDPWVPFSTTPYTVLADQGPTAGTTIRHDYQLDISWDDLPGTYATTLTYTLQTP